MYLPFCSAKSFQYPPKHWYSCKSIWTPEYCYKWIKKMFVILNFSKEKKNLEFDYFMWKNSVKISIASEGLLNRHQCFFRVWKDFTNFIVSIGIKSILTNVPNPIIKSSWFIQEFQTFCFRVKQIKKKIIYP